MGPNIAERLGSVYRDPRVKVGLAVAGVGTAVFISHELIRPQISTDTSEAQIPSISQQSDFLNEQQYSGLIREVKEQPVSPEITSGFAQISFINMKTGEYETIVVDGSQPRDGYSAEPGQDMDQSSLLLHIGYRPEGLIVEGFSKVPVDIEGILYTHGRNPETPKVKIGEWSKFIIDPSVYEIVGNIGDPYNIRLDIRLNKANCPGGMPDIYIVEGIKGNQKSGKSVILNTGTNDVYANSEYNIDKVSGGLGVWQTSDSSWGVYATPRVDPNTKCIDVHSKSTAPEPRSPNIK